MVEKWLSNHWLQQILRKCEAWSATHQVILHLTNADDQSTVKKLMPESLESLLEVLPIKDLMHET
jgi:hypothetical protein